MAGWAPWSGQGWVHCSATVFPASCRRASPCEVLSSRSRRFGGDGIVSAGEPRARRRAMSDTTTSPTYAITNPATGEVEKTFDQATDEQVEAALAGAHAAYQSWKDVPIEERAKV